MASQVIDKQEKERLLVDGLVSGQGLVESGKRAGFDRIDRGAMEMAISPKVRKFIRNSVKGRIDVEGSPTGYAILLRFLRDERTPLATRVDIAKFFISHSIAAPKAEHEGADNEKPLAEMSSTELQSFIEKTNTEMASRGLLIDASPRLAVDDLI